MVTTVSQELPENGVIFIGWWDRAFSRRPGLGLGGGYLLFELCYLYYKCVLVCVCVCVCVCIFLYLGFSPFFLKIWRNFFLQMTYQITFVLCRPFGPNFYNFCFKNLRNLAKNSQYFPVKIEGPWCASLLK